jgi:predicted SprT family Zn-dependent metalloprotease
MPNLFDQANGLILCWAKLWQVPELVESLRFEWSSRFTSSLGQAYPQRNLVRLNCVLQESNHRTLFEEVLCHEVAHVAVFWIHGNKAAIHGKEWKQLLTLCGFEPRRLMPTVLNVPRKKSKVIYRHFCPLCQTQRFARKACKSWRCTDCISHGLDGRLQIVSIPSSLGVL